MIPITERAQLMESLRLYRKKKLLTSLGGKNMQKMEGSVAKLRKPLQAKNALKASKVATTQGGAVDPNMGTTPKQPNQRMSVAAKWSNLRESNSKRTRVISQMLARIGAARKRGMKNPGNAGANRYARRNSFSNAGTTLVDPHGALGPLHKCTRRNMVKIKKIMHSDRSIVLRGMLRENEMVTAAKQGYRRGVPIVKSAADAYKRNRLTVKGNLQSSLLGKAAKKGVDLMGEARRVVQSGKISGSVSSRSAKASELLAKKKGTGTMPGSRYEHLTGGGPF